ncbi:MAG: DUF4129 domain-containing protein [Chitinophagaceae bacterium]
MITFTSIRFLLVTFFLVPCLAHSQYDTSILADTLLKQIQEEPVVIPEQDTEIEEDSPVSSFLKREDASNDQGIIQRHVPDSLVKKMQRDDAFWYANAAIKEENKKEEKESEYIPLGQRQWVQTLLWMIIIGGFAAAILWYLAGSNIGLFRKKNKALQTPGEEISESADIFAINYQKEIDKAETAGNYRLAIRLMFLRLLKDMADKNIIQYKPDRTNLDYLLQLHPTDHYKTFFHITRNYEYSWYGQFEVRPEAYQIIRNDFSQFDRKINKH